jgi:hypothetical protein
VEQPPARGDQAPRYQTFLLTCWQERDEVVGTVTWRFKLETPQSGSRRLFVTLKEAMEMIEKELIYLS